MEENKVEEVKTEELVPAVVEAPAAPAEVVEAPVIESAVEAAVEEIMEEPVVEPKGTKNLTEMLDLVIEGVNIVGLAFKDGKLSLEDAALLLRLVPKVAPALEGAGMIPSEAMDLTVGEGLALVDHVKAKLEIGDDRAKAIVASSLKMLVCVLELVVAVKG